MCSKDITKDDTTKNRLYSEQIQILIEQREEYENMIDKAKLQRKLEK